MVAGRGGKEYQVEPFTIRAVALLAAGGQPLDFDLPQWGDRLAAVENVRLDGHGGIPSSLLISLTAYVDCGARTLDEGAASSGPSGRTSQRLYWIGDMPCRWVRARLWRDDRHVDWRLSLHPTRIRELSISARVDYIRSLPGSLESAFGDPLQGDG